MFFLGADPDDIPITWLSAFGGLLILALNAVFDHGPRSPGAAWTRLSPFVCAHAAWERFVHVGYFGFHHSVFGQADQPFELNFHWSHSGKWPLYVLNVAAVAQGVKIYHFTGTPWTQLFALAYLLIWILDKFESPRPEELNTDNAVASLQDIADLAFICFGHFTYCYSTMSMRMGHPDMQHIFWGMGGTGVLSLILPSRTRPEGPRDGELLRLTLLLLSLTLMASGWLYGMSPLVEIYKANAKTVGDVENLRWMKTGGAALYAIGLFVYILTLGFMPTRRVNFVYGCAVLAAGWWYYSTWFGAYESMENGWIVRPAWTMMLG